MARTQWLVDGRQIAMKVKNATCSSNLQRNCKSDANVVCPNCNHNIQNSDLGHEWPGLPAGVKFDPSDQELREHLAAKIGIGTALPHIFIDEFILTLDHDHGICYTHPEELPGVKQDGSAIHFFHKTARAYNTGTRKCRKIRGTRDDVRWHKTGKTRPVFEDGKQKGCKKIMVLYTTSAKGSKADKTNWVMHQYHLGTQEDEEDGEFVVSKVFYQKQQRQVDKDETEIPQKHVGTCIIKGNPVTPKTSAPAPPRSGKCFANLDVNEDNQLHCMDSSGQVTNINPVIYQYSQSEEAEGEKLNDLRNASSGNSTWYAGESQCLDDSQELINEIFYCDEILENHFPEENNELENCLPSLPESGRIQSDKFETDLHHQPAAGHIPNNEVEKDLHHQSDASRELATIELDTPPDVHFTDPLLSSQESLNGWMRKNMDW